MALLICCAFIRAANGSGAVSTYAILLKLQEIEFDIKPITEIIKFYNESNIVHPFQNWNNNLKGIEGFLTNLQNFLVGYTNSMVNSIFIVINGIWTFLTQTVELLGQILDIAIYILGIKT